MISHTERSIVCTLPAASLLLVLLLLISCKADVNDQLPEDAFRVMSYNIQHARGMDGVVDPGRIAGVILDSGADIVALQEVDAGVERSGRRDIAAEIAEAAGLEYLVFGKNIDHQGGDYGNAILSRYPIIEDRNRQFETYGPEQRGVLQAVIDIDGRTLLIMNTHLDYSQDDRERMHYAESVQDSVLPRYETDAVIFAGDFNDVPGSRVYQRITEYLSDVWTLSGEGDGLTIPPNQPSRRIDYIFHDDGVVPAKATVLETMASDHLPIVAEFRFR